MKSTRRTPQEKKVDEYVRDGRNTLAESRSKAHKAISKRKAWVNRSFRKAAGQALASKVSEGEDAQLDAEVASLAVKRHGWRKVPDVPLADFLETRRGARRAGDLEERKQQLRVLGVRRARAKYGK